MGLYLFFQLMYFDFFMFLFLAEKFQNFSIQNVNYASFGAQLAGYFLSQKIMNVRRRILNFSISGGLLILCLIMLVGSLTLEHIKVDMMGFVALCKEP